MDHHKESEEGHENERDNRRKQNTNLKKKKENRMGNARREVQSSAAQYQW